MAQFIRIPIERIGALIGEKGEFKKHLQKMTGVCISVDSSTGDVTVDDKEATDALSGMKVGELVRAVGRGFSPDRALKLLRDDFYLATFDLRDYVGRKAEHIRRMRSRIIGTNGKTRRIIETLSGTDMSIYGNTVSIIGEAQELSVARTAVDMLLSGSEHSTVYRFLERKKKEMRMQELGYVEYKTPGEDDGEDESAESDGDGGTAPEGGSGDGENGPDEAEESPRGTK